MKIKSHFEDVDQLIAKVKAVTIKNKTRQTKFSAIGYPPQPVPTRWGSWSNAALYYAKNLPEVKAIMESFVGSGILVTQAKISLQKSDLAGQLLKTKEQYECLVKLIEKMESAKYTIKEAVQAIQKLDFGEDTSNINQYINKRMQNNDSNHKYGKAIYFTGCASQASKFSAHICFCRKKLFHVEKTVGEEKKF